jgi:hypothetical protein
MKPRKGNNRDLLQQILRVRQLAERYGLPLLFDGGQLELFTDGELRAYFYNLSDGIKSLVLEQNPEIARRWTFYDDVPVWEFIEQIDRLRGPSSRAQLLAREIGLEPITTAGRKSAERRKGRSFRRHRQARLKSASARRCSPPVARAECRLIPR